MQQVASGGPVIDLWRQLFRPVYHLTLPLFEVLYHWYAATLLGLGVAAICLLRGSSIRRVVGVIFSIATLDHALRAFFILPIIYRSHWEFVVYEQSIFSATTDFRLGMSLVWVVVAAVLRSSSRWPYRPSVVLDRVSSILLGFLGGVAGGLLLAVGQLQQSVVATGGRELYPNLWLFDIVSALSIAATGLSLAIFIEALCWIVATRSQKPSGEDLLDSKTGSL